MGKEFDSIKAPKTSKDKTQVVAEAIEEVEKAPNKSEDKKTLKKVIDKGPKEKRHFGKWFWFFVVIFSVLFVLLAGIAAGAYAHNTIYKNKVFPGVVVWGEDVGGKSFDEISVILNEKVKSNVIKLVGPDQEYEATVSDLGIVIDTETMALSAYSKGRRNSNIDNYLTRAKLLVSSIGWSPLGKIVRGQDLEIEPSYTLDENILNAYLAKISTNINIAPKDSQVTVANGTVNVVPAVFGREVQQGELKNQIIENVKNFRPTEIKIQTKELKPTIVDKAAEDVKVQTESVISRPITLTFEGQTYKPNKETVASWISYTKKEGADNYTMIVDPAKMKNYFSFLGTKVNIYAVDKRVRVENGVKETVIEEGKNGRLVDQNLLGKKIAEQLPFQPSVNLVIPTYVATFKTKYEHVLVADWDKYIDINISTQTMTAYLKGGEVVGSWKVTTGKSSTPTPVGTWLVHGKSAVTKMEGGTRGVDYYYLPNVHWVTWFKGGGYSIHEAYWRSTFGGMDYTWSGSHGCVNAPYSVAQFIYDWAPIGTPVIVHY